jgi:putative membrane protein
MWGDGMWRDGPGSWVVIAGIVMQFLFLAALVVAGYLVYRGVVQSSDSTDRALDELRVAYARGELSDEEYENRRERLERDS